jgi:hypothetical protein
MPTVKPGNPRVSRPATKNRIGAGVQRKKYY